MSNTKVQSSKECQISKPPHPSVTSPTDLKGREIIILLPLQGGGQEGDGVLGKSNG
jgi:hypothetical protein